MCISLFHQLCSTLDVFGPFVFNRLELTCRQRRTIWTACVLAVRGGDNPVTIDDSAATHVDVMTQLDATHPRPRVRFGRLTTDYTTKHWSTSTRCSCMQINFTRTRRMTHLGIYSHMKITLPIQRNNNKIITVRQFIRRSIWMESLQGRRTMFAAHTLRNSWSVK